MSRVYLSGPMTGLPGHNFPAFHAAAADLRRRGDVVLNPAENFGGLESLPRAEYMRLDLQHVLHADELLVLDGWEASRGAALEVAVAHELGLPVHEYDPTFLSCRGVEVQPGRLEVIEKEAA
ncbi:MAG: DUF4406 domain-containing protein [Planctomycetota bacterium]